MAKILKQLELEIATIAYINFKYEGLLNLYFKR